MNQVLRHFNVTQAAKEQERMHTVLNPTRHEWTHHLRVLPLWIRGKLFQDGSRRPKEFNLLSSPERFQVKTGHTFHYKIHWNAATAALGGQYNRNTIGQLIA